MAERKKPIDWRSSEARVIIITELELKRLPLDEKECSAEQAWAKYGKMVEFAHVPFSQFKARLADHRLQASRVDWKNSKARTILIEDLHEGFLPLDEEDLSAEEAWESVYSLLDEFLDVPFEQFEVRLADHRAQVKKDYLASIRDEVAFINSRRLYPRSPLNRKGEKVFDMTTAQELLRQDIKNGLGKSKSPEQIRLSRKEYMEFEKTIFHGRVRQAIRRDKFENFMKKKKQKKKGSSL
jgi:hypothetical protein